MIIQVCGTKHIVCNGCGLTIWNHDKETATQIRSRYKENKWRLIVGDGYKYGDYCPECISKNKHKKNDSTNQRSLERQARRFAQRGRRRYPSNPVNYRSSNIKIHIP